MGKLSSDNNKVFMIQTVIGSSSQLSTMGSIMRDIVLEKFPKNFFKHIYVDTARTITEENRNKSYNQNVNKIQYPSLTMSVEMSLDDTLNVRNWNAQNPYMGLRVPIDKNYICIYRDQKNRADLYATCDYVTSKFRFKIATNSYVQNVDLANYLNNRFKRDFFNYVSGKIVETEVPKTIIKIISDMNSMSPTDDEGLNQLSTLLTATSRTKRALVRKINQRTGKEAYYIQDEHDILTLFSDLDAPATIIRDEMSDGEYIIEFTLQASSWQFNNFILSMRRDVFQGGEYGKYFPKDAIVNGEVKLDITDETNDELMVRPITDLRLAQGKMTEFIDAFNRKQIGSMIKNELFTRPVDHSPEEGLIVDFMESMPDEYKWISGYINERLSDKAMTQLFKFRIFTNDGELVDGEDYIIDYDNLRAIIHKFYDSEIKVVLYMNRVFYEILLKCKETGSDYGNINGLGTWDVFVDDDYRNYKMKILVKRIPSMYRKDNMLRIRTPLGIGYIPLETPLDADVCVKVCTGVDKEGNPIIKQLKEI